jgi:hypothetical protein
MIPGDANGDGVVDVGDLGILATNYGTTTGATWDRGDFNHDGAVDIGDLGILAANYGQPTAASSHFALSADKTEMASAAGASVPCSVLGLLTTGIFLLSLLGQFDFLSSFRVYWSNYGQRSRKKTSIAPRAGR